MWTYDLTMLSHGRIDDLITDGNGKAEMRVRKRQRLLSIDEPVQTTALACRPSLMSDFLTERSDLLDDGVVSANDALGGKVTHFLPLRISCHPAA